MFSVVALIGWRGGADPAAGEARVRGLDRQAAPRRSSVAPTLPASRGAGDLVWRMMFADADAWAASGAEAALDRLEADADVASLEVAAYPVRDLGVRRPDLRDGVYRALFVSLDDGTPAAVAEAFSGDVAAMPDHIPQILNWALSPVARSRGTRRWTHLWEQEFASVDDLTGPYMTHPYHWAFVDRWFDPEMPEQIVRVDAIRHSASPLATSLLA
jgi:hypothetical protein